MIDDDEGVNILFLLWLAWNLLTDIQGVAVQCWSQSLEDGGTRLVPRVPQRAFVAGLEAPAVVGLGLRLGICMRLGRGTDLRADVACLWAALHGDVAYGRLGHRLRSCVVCWASVFKPFAPLLPSVGCFRSAVAASPLRRWRPLER